MPDMNTSEYYRGRERQERTLADRAVDPTIAAIHRDMAQRYSELTVQAQPGLSPSRTGMFRG